MVAISQVFLPVTSNCRTGIKRQVKWIVIHETGNKENGANAKAHASYLNNVAKAKTPSVSWHYTVDDHEIYQHIPDDEVAWHAGDGGSGTGNVNGIGIEHCVNPDGDFNKTMKNGAELVGYLLYKYGFKNAGGAVRQHWEFTQKNCPQTIRETGRWQEYLNMCQAELEKLLNPITITPPTPPQPTVDYKTLSENLQSQLNSKNADITAFQKTISEKANEISILNKDIENYKSMVADRETRIISLTVELETKKNELLNAENKISTLNDTITKQKSDLLKAQTELENLNLSNGLKNYSIAELIAMIFNKIFKK